VSFRGQRVQLTATEFRILEYLVTRPNRVNSRDDIIDAALGRDTAVFHRTIDVHITALRKKLGPGGVHIETVRGFGYKWADEPAA
jgi:DNA-binding response OmpR family regulator